MLGWRQGVSYFQLYNFYRNLLEGFGGCSEDIYELSYTAKLLGRKSEADIFAQTSMVPNIQYYHTV